MCNSIGFEIEYLIFAPNLKIIKMSGIRTFTMLKPDAVEKGHVGAILEQIASAGFRIVAMKLTQMTHGYFGVMVQYWLFLGMVTKLYSIF